MITIQVTELIDRPVADVYALAGSLDNDLLWRMNLSRKQHTPGLPYVGMTFQEAMNYQGSYFTLTAVVEAVEPNHRLAFRTVNTAMSMQGQRVFEAVGPGQTRFTYELTIEPTGLYKLLPALTHELFSQQIQRDLLTLKRVVTARPRAALATVAA
ncbi:SRPBCC family protein [Fibrella sp. HMF5335]|uniref:SRPBCC family protein n=1 Tax=Fibrella rubiginis TaxID=2817060 RepID=A0A939GBA6_9BACT|nr:SRPBCC family protein [Fibrella rubiginis]MBO0935877.1 SRPBCC family protein [Fibrella rubiginis]